MFNSIKNITGYNNTQTQPRSKLANESVEKLKNIGNMKIDDKVFNVSGLIKGSNINFTGDSISWNEPDNTITITGKVTSFDNTSFLGNTGVQPKTYKKQISDAILEIYNILSNIVGFDTNKKNEIKKGIIIGIQNAINAINAINYANKDAENDKFKKAIGEINKIKELIDKDSELFKNENKDNKKRLISNILIINSALTEKFKQANPVTGGKRLSKKHRLPPKSKKHLPRVKKTFKKKGSVFRRNSRRVFRSV